MGRPAPPSSSEALRGRQQQQRKRLTVWGFAFVATTLVAGGPFGLEMSVRDAGPLPVFLCFLLLPILFAFPQALITAELSTLFRDNGGVILWTRAAFGDLAAWVVGFCTIVGNLVDLGLYPLLVAEYVSSAFKSLSLASSTSPQDSAVPGVKTPFKIGGADMAFLLSDSNSPSSSSAWWWSPAVPASGLSSTAQVVVFLVVVALGLVINLRGMRDVGLLSAAAFVLMMIPFVLSLLIQLPKVAGNVNAVMQISPSIEWASFLSTMLWGYSGWASLGSIAGEIQRPAATFPKGIGLTMALVTACYALPTLVSITTHPNYADDWMPGSLAAFTGDVGPILKQLCIFSSVACQISVFTAGLSTNARTIWALAAGKKPTAVGNFQNGPYKSSSGQEGTKKALDFTSNQNHHDHHNDNDGGAGGRNGGSGDGTNNILPAIFAFESPSTGAPVVALISSCAVISLLSALPFQSLVQADILLACVPLLVMVLAFIRLRMVYPPEKRVRVKSAAKRKDGSSNEEDNEDDEPFVVPFGWRGVVAVSLPKSSVILLALYTARLSTWLVLLAVVFTALKIYAGQRFLYHTPQGNKLREKAHFLLLRLLPAFSSCFRGSDRSSSSSSSASYFAREQLKQRYEALDSSDFNTNTNNNNNNNGGGDKGRLGAGGSGGGSNDSSSSSSSSYTFGDFVSPPPSKGVDLLIMRQLDDIEEQQERQFAGVRRGNASSSSSSSSSYSSSLSGFNRRDRDRNGGGDDDGDGDQEGNAMLIV